MQREWIEQIFKRGTEKGFSAQELYYQSNKGLRLSLYEGEVEQFSSSETLGVSYRGILNGKMGYAYTERLDSEAIETLVKQASENASIIESEDAIFLHDGNGDYIQIETFNPELSTRELIEKRTFLEKVEAGILNRDTRVTKVSRNVYAEGETTRRIVNTLGLDLEDRANWCQAFAICVAESNGDIQTGIGYSISDDLNGLSAEKIVDEAVEKAVSKLGGKSMPSGNYPVVFQNDVFSEIFSAYSMLFSAERVQKGLSAFKDKLGEKVAVSELTLIDDPHIKGGLASSTFDSEGVPTMPKTIIESGVLKTYLHNLKTAHKDGVQSTGNASKGSYKGTIGIAPSNLLIENGRISFETLIAPIEIGVCIEEVQGLHAGLNAISGDFSLQCTGFLIENGQRSRPVREITVSGNYFELLFNIDALANDQVFSLMAEDYIAAPSVRVRGLTISGE